MSALTDALCQPDELHALLKSVEGAALSAAFSPNAVRDESAASAVARLRVIANLSFQELVHDVSLSNLLHRGWDELRQELHQADLVQAFYNWEGYLDAAFYSGADVDIDDVAYFTACGLLADRPTDVRATLKSDPVEDLLNSVREEASSARWGERVRSYISLSLSYLVRQDSKDAVQIAGHLINKLSEDQKEFEEQWLGQAGKPSRRALELLSLYHVAQAVVRTSEYLLSGSVISQTGRSKNFAPELRRLLDRAEEYAESSNDAELSYWLRAVGLSLSYLHASSIWNSAYGTSELLDRFIDNFPDNSHPIFSLLPSQQEALRQHLLDRSRVAIVLQMPTSAGKTLLAEFSILQTIEAYGRETRIVYVVPTRALATQVKRTLAVDLAPLDIEVFSAGSAFEEDPYELNLLSNSQGILVATPEKLDLLLRSHADWFENLRLVVVDEAHLLKDGSRGARLELLLANIRREHEQARLLLLTPFVSNAREIAGWLGGDRGAPISVHWKPSRHLVGIAALEQRNGKNFLSIDWRDPHTDKPEPHPTGIALEGPKSRWASITKRASRIAKEFEELGSSLIMFPGSPAYAEAAAGKAALDREDLPVHRQTPELRVAIALAEAEYGEGSNLAKCLRAGVAFHHGSLSPELRFLVEDLVRTRVVDLICATTTLAQGMNFPVASVVVHSVRKPWNTGDLSPGEFWNIAGRAGRVGLVDRGLVVFANDADREKANRYLAELNEPLESAVGMILGELRQVTSLKEAYRKLPQLRALLQYLLHSVALQGGDSTAAELEELLQASLFARTVREAADRRAIRDIALRYVQEVTRKREGYLKTVDSTGLGSFSFDELYARIQSDPALKAGPQELLVPRGGTLEPLLDALSGLPELELAIGKGSGPIDLAAVTRVVEGWVQGRSIRDLSPEFPGPQGAALRNAGRYVYSKVSQMVSWGAHAYLRGWSMTQRHADQDPEVMMLPAYIQYGVRSPEAAVASLLGIPRALAESWGEHYREGAGALTPQESGEFKRYLEDASGGEWADVVQRSPLAGKVDPEDVRQVWRSVLGGL